MTADIRLEQLVGRVVLTANNRPLGRIEEAHAELRDDGWFLIEWVVGPAGLLERVGLSTRLILGIGQRHGFVVRWNQLDLSNPDRPRLACSIDELRQL
jgi:hypothetical protein